MSDLVVDASFASAIVIPAQRTAAAVAFATGFRTEMLIAPYVFGLETPWLFLKYERRIKAPGFARRALRQLSRLEVRLAEAPERADRDQALTLALHRNMGFYDAMYLLLAVQVGAPLATRDGRMISAAQELGVVVVDVR